jgi:glutathione S-transferase
MHAPATLVTIPFSHYCEKARWALQRAGVPFVEKAHLPFFHAAAVRRAGGTRQVPILVTDGTVVPDSTTILRHADQRLAEAERLFPADEKIASEVERLVALADEKIGPATRRIAYFHLLPDRKALGTLFERNATGFEGRFAALCQPLLAFGIKKGVGIDRARAERAQATLDITLDAFDALLADGRRYLAGDRFTAADLTLAALAAPLAFPTELASIYGTDAELPQGLLPKVEAVRARRSGAFVLRVYREQRARRLNLS